MGRWCWILEDTLLHCYFIWTTHFTFHSFLYLPCNARSRFRGNILILLMYSDCINALDPHTIITISFVLWLCYMFFLTDGFACLVFDSSGWHFVFFAIFLRITKDIICLHNTKISLGILLICCLVMLRFRYLLSLMYLDFVCPSPKSSHSSTHTNLCLLS